MRHHQPLLSVSILRAVTAGVAGVTVLGSAAAHAQHATRLRVGATAAYRAPDDSVVGPSDGPARAIPSPRADSALARRGEEVRVTARTLAPGAHRGRLARSSADSVWLELANGGARLALARGEVTGLEVRRERPGTLRRSRLGALLGAFGGGAVGASVGHAWPTCADGCQGGQGTPTAVGLALGALTGAGLGALLGDLVERPRWVPGRLP